MTCSDKTRLVLFVAYVIAIVSALANPARINYEDAYLMTQGANVVTLLLLAYCKRGWADALIASILGVAFALRATGSWRGGSRWDSLLVTLGMIIVLQHAFYQVVPKRVPFRPVLYLGFSCIILPVLSSLPYLLQQPRVEQDVLVRAASFSSEAYDISKKEQGTLLGPLWTLYDESTDTSAGVTRVIGQSGSTDLYVYFGGSKSRENWKTNANVLGDTVPADWGCDAPNVMRTHKGFTKAFQSVAPKLLVALETELGNLTGNPRVIFCGHSLGGALATMAGLYVACKIPRIRENMAVVTFGAPQVGDANFVKFFDQVVPRSVRVVNPMDPVPRLLNVQLVHVKGYYPVSTVSLNITKAHSLSTYTAAVKLPRSVSIAASFLPAVVVAMVAGGFIAWQLKR